MDPLQKKIVISTTTEKPLIITEPTNTDILINNNVEATIITQGKIAITINLQKEAILNYYHINNQEGTNINSNQYIILLGTHAQANITNLSYGKNDEQSTITTTIEHEAAHTKSKFQARGIMRNKATNKSLGLIKINKQAHNAAGNQDIKTLIFEEAQAYNLPKLVIDNNDVQCSHASSVGQPEQEQLFYLQSRGLTEEEAINTLIKGFYEPVLTTLPINIQSQLRTLIEERL
ncbi:MAG: SufD family Fe-S cluster assembly protein [Nanoarchaeota archaeon]|nr:SufD family Fe-S cluster assembly protein [Nanoarchaeota archaeon]